MAGTITALTVQKRNPRRVNVYLDGVYAFPLDIKVATAAGLKCGQVLSEEEIADLIAADGLEKAYDRALRYLSYRPRSTAEMRRYLAGKKIPADLAEKVIARLTANGLLDDAAFARFWAENRAAFSPRSGRLLSQELRQKGVDAAHIAAVLPQNEAEGARQVARRKARTMGHLDYQTFRRRMLGCLQRRGYDYELAQQITQEIWDEIH